MGCVPSLVLGPGATHKVADIYYGSGSVTLSNRRPNDGSQSLSGLRQQIKLPLNEKEVFAITKSWKAISRNMTDIGIRMFLNMFELRSDVKLMFEQFRSVEKADLGTSRALENHALLVMNALDEAIANMDDPEYLIDMLLTTGRSHRRFEDFMGEIFWAIEEPFVAAARDCLADRFNANMERIYRKAIHFVLDTLILGFKHNLVDDNSPNDRIRLSSALS